MSEIIRGDGHSNDIRLHVDFLGQKGTHRMMINLTAQAVTSRSYSDAGTVGAKSRDVLLAVSLSGTSTASFLSFVNRRTPKALVVDSGVWGMRQTKTCTEQP